jgi:alpha-galactosidase
MHKRWWANDPDCLLLAADDRLTDAEVELMASAIALTGGSLVVSDELSSLPNERLEMLGRLLPPIGERPHTLDWFDRHTPARLQLDLTGPAGDWHLIGLFNWEDKPADLPLRLADFYLDPRLEYYASSFWDRKICRFAQEHNFPAVPPHGAVVAALRPAGRFGPQYLGGDLHISQGLEVAGWDVQANRLQLRLQRPGTARGRVVLALPQPPGRAMLENGEIAWVEEISGVYRFNVEFDQAGSLDVAWG